MFSRVAALAVTNTAAQKAGSCGGDQPSTVQDCQNVDLGSCGNACCKMDFKLNLISSDQAMHTLNKTLSTGGPDGNYELQMTAEGTLGFGDLKQFGSPKGIDWIGQVYHTTSGAARYVDTVNFNIVGRTCVDLSLCSTVRAFSTSQIGGALGDNGQNYKNIINAMKHAFGEDIRGNSVDGSCPAASVSISSESSVGDYMSSWVTSQEGKRVGSDASHHQQTECWDLGMAAIEHARSNGFDIPRSPSTYVWSSQTVSYEDAEPGDIMQFANYKEKYGHHTMSTADRHTAVVTKSFDSATCGVEVEQQNPNPVSKGVYHPCSQYKTGGTVIVYRLGSSSPSPPPSPTPSPSPSPSGCADAPSDWKSSEGDSCEVYESYNYCTSAGAEGSGWKHSRWGPISNYADSQGRSAFDACCTCGGGSRMSNSVKTDVVV